MYLTADRSRKRRQADRLFGIHTFGDPGCPADYDGAFRENMRAFLSDCATFEPYCIEGMPTWSVALEENTHAARISLLILEEGIHSSRNPHCDHCRCIGWRNHPVSKRRYHFIIPAPEVEERPNGLAGVAGGKICPNCKDPVPSPMYNCNSCGEQAIQGSILDLQTHLLHGVFHTNGFGHLICLNGREKGSKYASGREIMDLWDRICSMLRARKISVEDQAKKRGLELRLIHCVAYGESWFGRWGYRFGRGSFGITPQMYTKAIEAIRGMPLTVMIQHFESVDQEILAIVSNYQRISGQVLQTVGDLIRFMMELKARLPLNSEPKSIAKFCKDSSPNSSGFIAAMPVHSTADMPCRWSVKRLDLATQVIVEALKSCEKKWMPRQDVRDAARVYIGDTGLLDFVLKSLGNRVVGGHVVRRAVNPITKVLEYCLEDVNSLCCSGNSNSKDSKSSSSDHISDLNRADVLQNIVYLYKNVLENYKPARKGCKSVLTAIPTASRIILDTKQFIKDYVGEKTRKCANNEWNMDDDGLFRVMCTVIIKEDFSNPARIEADLSRISDKNPPAELIILPPHATVGDLKQEAQRAFGEIYQIMQGLRVESVVGCEAEDEDLLFGTIESGAEVGLQGIGIDLCSDLRFEGGIQNWVVDCPCGTKDDDGERMISCDMCEIWQHTRCGGISDLDPFPVRFVCHRCGQSLFQAMLN